jgi:3-hydroxyisobutyrate dehydrogenase-like beta-hydroxyacid dehydrogenase
MAPVSGTGQVSVIGLGNMGSAIVRALLSAGHRVTIWNRSPERAEPLEELGAVRAEHLCDVVAASAVIFICINSYATSVDLLDQCQSVAGKTIVQITTATPAEAVAMEQWARERGASFVEGMMMTLPQEVGTDTCRSIYGGQRSDYLRIEALVAAFGGVQRWISEEIGAVSALTVAAAMFWMLSVESFVLMASVAHSLGASLEDAFEELVYQQRPIALAMSDSLPAMSSHVRTSDTVSIDLALHDLRKLTDLVETQGFDASLLKAAAQYLDAASSAGYGGGPIGSIAHTLRRA